MLTVYSKTVCPYCVQAKNYLIAKNINFKEINIETDTTAREFVQAQGHRSVPQIYYQGKLFVEGGWQGLSKMTTDDIITEMELRDSLSEGTL